MPSETIRFIDTGLNHGRFNMAADYYAARNFLDRPTFRVYRWNPFTVSLGYHQDITEIDRKECEKRGYGLVRRETGGRAVFHSEELTYSMVIPRTSKFYSDSILDVYNRISTVLVKALRSSGVKNADLQKGKAPDFKELYKEKLSSVCFSSTSSYEVVTGEKKLVGSAQKRLRESVLQHGSILVGKKHLELIDLLNINDSLKDKFRKLTEKKTATVSENTEVGDSERFYAALTLNLKSALEEEFGEKTEDFSFDGKDLLEISGIERYFIL